MVVVITDGKINFFSPNGSTLPDNPKDQYGSGLGHATVLPGVYYIRAAYSGGDDKYIGFATGINKNPYGTKNSDIPVFRFYNARGQEAPGVYMGNDCDIHPGWNQPKAPSSTGCITIYREDYGQFITATRLNENFDYSKTDFKNPYWEKEINYDDLGKDNAIPVPDISGAMVIDRSLADPKYLKSMYETDENVNIIMGGR